MGAVPIRQMPLAAQTERLLRERIERELSPGDRLPAEVDLAAEYQVSRATVRSAITALVHQGLVTQRHGVGNFVALGAALTNNLAEAVSLTEVLGRGGPPPPVVFDRIAIEAAPADIARDLRIAPGDDVLVNSKRFVDGERTLVYVINSIPLARIGRPLAKRAVEDPAILEPLFDFLRSTLGIELGVQLARLSAQTGDQIEYPSPRPDPDLALLRIDETGFDTDDQPVWHSHTWFPPHSMTIELIRQPVHRPS